MFTGIVEETGRVRSVSKVAGAALLTFDAPLVSAGATPGDSIAVNGCCLTVVDAGDGWWSADAVPETLARTNLGGLVAGDRVNFERPVRLADRLGGHLVQGHVDATAVVRERRDQPDGSAVVRFEAPRDVLRYVVYKGSVAVDGVSLTVAVLDDDGFSVALVPHTLSVTTLGDARPGVLVNIEADVVAKYVERLVAPPLQGGGASCRSTR